MSTLIRMTTMPKRSRNAHCHSFMTLIVNKDIKSGDQAHHAHHFEERSPGFDRVIFSNSKVDLDST